MSDHAQAHDERVREEREQERKFGPYVREGSAQAQHLARQGKPFRVLLPDFACPLCDLRHVSERGYAVDGVRVCDLCYGDWLASPAGLVAMQVRAGSDALERDPDDFLVWPWPELERITQPMAPGQGPYFFAAFSGNGKTTFSWSAVNAWAASGVPGYVLPLETRDYEWRTGLACCALGTSPAVALSGKLRRLEKAGDPDARQTREMIRAELERQEREWLDVLHVSPVPGVTLDILRAEARKAADLGCRYLLVDHIDHVEPDDYTSAVAESQRLNRALVGLAQETDMVFVCASQLNMDIVGGDALARYSPPQPKHLMFPAVKNQVAACILGLYRPVDEHADPELLAKAKRGEVEAYKVLKPHAMAVNVVKLRHQDGDAREGARCQLAVRHGRVESLDANERVDYEADRAGVRTSANVLRFHRPAA